MEGRAAALAACILLLFPAAALAAPWEGERSVTGAVTIPAGQALVISPGTNLSLGVPLPGASGSRPFIEVLGALEVCGTADSPVVFRADSAVFSWYRAPAALRLDGGPFSIRNASFIEMVVEVDNSSGSFEDCTFIDCDIIVQGSPAVFQNCTFEWASNLNITGEAGGPRVLVSGCRFNGSQGWRICEWRWDTHSSAVEVNGPVLLEGTNITAYGYGARLNSGRARLSECNISYCYFGMDLGPGGPVEILGTTIENCLYAGVRTGGSLDMRGSTVRGCRYGIVLDGPPGSDSVYSFSGNRLCGNFAYGIAHTRPSVDPGDTLFECGGAPNAGGRMLRFVRLTVNVVDRAQNGLRFYWLNVTDRYGNCDNRSWSSSAAALTLPDFLVDNNGSRREFFPYTITAYLKGSSNRTVVPAVVDSLTLVVPSIADLVPTAVTTVPARPLAGQRISCTLVVQNRGTAASAPASARLSFSGQAGVELEVPAIGPGASVAVSSRLRVPDAGRLRLDARVDTGGVVAESDETNNALVASLEVGPAPKPPPVMVQVMGAMVLTVLAVRAALGARRRT